MAISGLVAGGFNAALDDVNDRRLRELVRQLQEKQQADQLALQRDQLASVNTDREAMRENTRRQIDLSELTRRDRNNERGLELMDKDRQAMDVDAAVGSLPAHLKPIGGLFKIGALGKLSPEDLEAPEARAARAAAAREQTVQDQIRVRNATRQPQQPRERRPEWVRQADGSVIDINGVAPPGTTPVTPSGASQQADKDAANERALTAMKAYGDDMLSVIDTLIDEQGNLKPDAAGVIGGFEGARPEWAYGSEGSQGALANIDRLQSMLNIDTLRDMKSQSRTGATGFGALSERELNVVESSASKLRRRRQGDKEYAAELKRLRDAIMTGRQKPTVDTKAPNADTALADLVYDPATKSFKPKGKS